MDECGESNNTLYRACFRESVDFDIFEDVVSYINLLPYLFAKTLQKRIPRLNL